MKIGLDGRLINETGVGRYIQNLIFELSLIDKENQYVVFVKKDDSWSPPNNRWQKRIADIPWHSVREQIELPKLFAREKLDLVHIPYFTIPIFYPGKFITTIHDLTVLHYPTGKATTLPRPVYWAKLLGYRAILEVGLHRASHIIAVSEATKEELMDHFAIDERKISVMYEGVRKEKTTKTLIEEPYILYVGNAYPHKNLEVLLRAVGKHKLVLVGKEDIFYKELKKRELPDNITFFGQAGDEALQSLYGHAVALVFPSKMEGFGLPALEAAVHGTPVICSDIAVFHEILGPIGNYFKSSDVSGLADLINQAFEKKLKKPTAQEQKRLIETFSWHTMALQTLQVYKSAII